MAPERSSGLRCLLEYVRDMGEITSTLGDGDGGAKEGVGSVENVADVPRYTVCSFCLPSTGTAIAKSEVILELKTQACRFAPPRTVLALGVSDSDEPTEFDTAKLRLCVNWNRDLDRGLGEGEGVETSDWDD
jgi:hypothetical protein